MAKKINVASHTTKNDDIKLKNKDSSDHGLPLTKYPSSVYKMVSAKQKEWCWQDCKKAKDIEQDIIAAKKR